MSYENEIKKKFGKTLRSLRLQKSISQEKLAELSNLHRTYISEVERGNRNISIVNIFRICASLEIDPASFFDEMQKEQNNEGK